MQRFRAANAVFTFAANSSMSGDVTLTADPADMVVLAFSRYVNSSITTGGGRWAVSHTWAALAAINPDADVNGTMKTLAEWYSRRKPG